MERKKTEATGRQAEYSHRVVAVVVAVAIDARKLSPAENEIRLCRRSQLPRC